MKCIKVITDEDFGLHSIAFDNPRHRYGARGIIFNKDNKIAILNKTKKNEYKLVGGGIEEDEEPAEAFQREVLEEAGCYVEIDECLGTTEELKTLDNFKQTSYVYVAHVIEDTNQTKFTDKEIAEGSQLLWLDLDEAMKLIKDSENKIVSSNFENIYHTRFIVKRDYEILNYYKSINLRKN